eukprot:CAMPEP_0117592262 /NCGR_PEP_ID=MMETSP0784-20121206/71984_1 /TAXON_ID=39447 /ORGANISM="" /LENGTH=266 /DNA_ID=CAMNT_0005394063 /DNA_START=70 /DNA_END=867 /DNA_ORIENTATION=+
MQSAITLLVGAAIQVGHGVRPLFMTSPTPKPYKYTDENGTIVTVPADLQLYNHLDRNFVYVGIYPLQPAGWHTSIIYNLIEIEFGADTPPGQCTRSFAGRNVKRTKILRIGKPNNTKDVDTCVEKLKTCFNNGSPGCGYGFLTHNCNDYVGSLLSCINPTFKLPPEYTQALCAARSVIRVLTKFKPSCFKITITEYSEATTTECCEEETISEGNTNSDGNTMNEEDTMNDKHAITKQGGEDTISDENTNSDGDTKSQTSNTTVSLG